jgi:hypothetical protein
LTKYSDLLEAEIEETGTMDMAVAVIIETAMVLMVKLVATATMAADNRQQRWWQREWQRH